MITTSGKDFAVQTALKPTKFNFADGSAASDGNIVLGISKDHVAISFNNTEYNQNSLVTLTMKDAETLKTLLNSIYFPTA
jgi:hypothetical protein